MWKWHHAAYCTYASWQTPPAKPPAKTDEVALSATDAATLRASVEGASEGTSPDLAGDHAGYPGDDCERGSARRELHVAVRLWARGLHPNILIPTAVCLVGTVLSGCLGSLPELQVGFVVTVGILVAGFYTAGPRTTARIMTMGTATVFAFAMAMDVFVRSVPELEVALDEVSEWPTVGVMLGIAVVSGATLGFQPNSWLSVREKRLAAALYTLTTLFDYLVCCARTTHPRASIVLWFTLLLAASFPAGACGRRRWERRRSD